MDLTGKTIRELALLAKEVTEQTQRGDGPVQQEIAAEVNGRGVKARTEFIEAYLDLCGAPKLVKGMLQ